MHTGLRNLTAALALLGLAAGCERERGRLGEEQPVERQSITEMEPEVIGGEALEEQEIYGRVIELSPERLTVRDDAGVVLTLEVEPDTTFTLGGERVDRARLQEGMRVRASYDEPGGEYTADTVELFPLAPPEQAD